jgi:hypothetical protein
VAYRNGGGLTHESHGETRLDPDGPAWISPVDRRANAYLGRVVLNPRDKNATIKPSRTGRLVVGPARVIERSNLEPRQSVFDGEPLFDRNRLKTGHHVDHDDHRIVGDGDNAVSLTGQLKTFDTGTGASVPAVCEGALAGSDVSARTTTKIGATNGYDALIGASRPTPDEFAVQMLNPFFYFRCHLARVSYGDIRRQGKVRCRPDETYIQEAAIGAERAYWKTVSPDYAWDWWLLDLIDEARTPIMGFFLLWIFAAVMRDPAHKNIHKFERGLAPFTPFPRSDEDEERRLARLYRAGDVVAGNRLIAGHLWISKAVAKKYSGETERDDIEQEGVFGLYKALAKFDPETGNRFSTVAYKAVKWAIEDYLRRLRRLRRGGSFDDIAESDNPEVLGLYAP